MNILFVNFVDKIAGGERYIANVINSLPENINIFLLTPNKNSQIEHLIERNIFKESLKFKRTFGPFPRLSLPLLFKTIKIIKRDKIDIIHLNDHYLFPTFIIIKYLFGIKVIFTSHGKWDTYFLINRIFLKLLNPITIASTDIQYKRVDKNVEKVFLMPFFVKGVTSNVRKINKKIKLGIVGRFSPVKNFELAFSIIDSLDKDIYELHIFGNRSVHLDEESNEYLTMILEEVSKRENIISHGVILDHNQLYKDIDILLLTSKTESFSLVSIEALSFAIPVVSTPTEGSSTIIKDGFNGFVCKTKEEFTESIKIIVKNYKYFSQNSLLFCKNFNKEKYIEKLVKIYND